MLVLTRKAQERVQIGDQITITILRVRGREVQIGIEAPQQFQILRAELLETNPDARPANGRQHLVTPPSTKTSAGSFEPNSDRCPTDTAAPSCELSSTPTETVGPRPPAPRPRTASIAPPPFGAEPASSHRRVVYRGVRPKTTRAFPKPPCPTIVPAF